MEYTFSIVSCTALGFFAAGVWMIHSLYTSTKPKFQTFLAWMIVFLFTLITAWCFVELDIVEGPHLIKASIITGMSCILVYLYVFDTIPIFQRIFVYFFINNLMYIIVVASRYFAVIISKILPQVHADLLFLIVDSALIVSFTMVFKYKLKKVILYALAIFEKQLKVITVFSCISYIFIISTIDPWKTMQNVDSTEIVYVVLSCTVVISAYVIAFKALILTHNNAIANVNAIRVQENLKQNEKFYKNFMENIERTKELRHDLNYHMMVVESLSRNERWEELKQYTSELIKKSENTSIHILCRDYSVNSILVFYKSEAEENNIRFTCSTNISENISEYSVHLCIIIGNALQNALEACMKIEDTKEKYIDFKAKLINGNILIEIRNSFNGILKKENGKILTSKDKEMHGLGLQSIQTVIDSREGTMHISNTESEFNLRILLKIIPYGNRNNAKNCSISEFKFTNNVIL